MTLPMGRALRDAFGWTVTELAAEDPRILMLDADTGSSTKADVFQKAYPERYLQMGIAEQNMLGVAAGLAATGFVPFVSTFVAFAVIRPLDQIRVLIAQTGLNVKICGGYAGVFTGATGKTHLIVDDLAIMRAMPGIITVAPADDVETVQVLKWAAAYDGPVYIRLVRDVTQRLFDESYRFTPGRAVVVREGTDVSLISTGTQTPRVVDAAEILATRGIEAGVLHVPTLKPIDVDAIVAAAERSPLVVTVEEGTVIGGLGGAVSETLSEHRPSPVRRIGLQDIYGESATNAQLLEKYGLSAERVADKVQALVEAQRTGRTPMPVG
jgi:transketolase